MNKIKQWLDAVMTGNANVGKPMQDTDVVLSYGGAQVTVADILALCTTPQQSPLSHRSRTHGGRTTTASATTC